DPLLHFGLDGLDSLAPKGTQEERHVDLERDAPGLELDLARDGHAAHAEPDFAQPVGHPVELRRKPRIALAIGVGDVVRHATRRRVVEIVMHDMAHAPSVPQRCAPRAIRATRRAPTIRRPSRADYSATIARRLFGDHRADYSATIARRLLGDHRPELFAAEHVE